MIHRALAGILSQQALAGGGGGGVTPVQRGSAVNVGYGTTPAISAPAGLQQNDVVFIVRWSDDADDPNWALTGFTNIFEVQAVGVSVWLTILRGTMGASPPASFTPTTAATISNWTTSCVAYSGGLATGVVGTPVNSNPNDPGGNIPGITVANNNSLVLAFGFNQFGQLGVPGWTAVLSTNNLSVHSQPFNAGPTGDVPFTPTQAYQPSTAVLVSVPPA